MEIVNKIFHVVKASYPTISLMQVENEKNEFQIFVHVFFPSHFITYYTVVNEVVQIVDYNVILSC